MSLFLNTSLFLSTHVNKVDAKGRVSFPAGFRSAMSARNSQGVVIFRSLREAAIEGYTIERMQEMATALEQLSPFSPQRAHFETAIFGTAQELVVDKEGRCSLPRDLASAVGIGDQVAFVGKGATFQIWAPAALEAAAKAAAQAVASGEVEFPTLKGLL